MKIQQSKAKELRENASSQQVKNCKHEFAKEYNFGADTGDMVCSKCGKIK